MATYYLERNQPGTVIYNASTIKNESNIPFDQFSDHDKVLYLLDCMEKDIPEEVIPITFR